MTLVSSFCFLVAFFIALSCIPRGSDLFSPARVFGFIWSVALGLADLKLSGYQHAWGTFAWITLLVGIFSFFFGVFVVQVILLDQKLYSVKHVRDCVRKELLREDILFIIIVFLFLCYSLAYVVEWLAFGSLPVFAAYPDKARVDIGLFGVHLFVIVMPIILFLIFEYFLLVKKMALRKLILLSIFGVIFVSYLLLLNRFLYVMFFIMAIGFAYYASRQVKLRYVLIPISVLVAVMSYIQSIRESRYAEHYLYVVSKMRFSSAYAAFTMPYMYIVMNLENYARAVERLERHAYGYFSFDVVLALAGIKHWMGDYFGLKERVFLNSGYNTFPFFWDYYYDFGLLGITIIPAMLGCVAALLHKHMRTNPSVKSVALYSVAIFVMAISFFTNNLSSLNFVFAVITLLAAQTALMRFSLRDGRGRQRSDGRSPLGTDKDVD